MKKNLFKLLPVLLVTSCSTLVVDEEFVPYVDMVDGLPTVHAQADSTFKTYLMLSRYGYLDIADAPVKGKVSELFYENTVTWLGDPGTPLPDATQVKNETTGVTFRGWAYYDQEASTIYPTYYTTVPNIEGLALKAIFDGTDAGGGGGGGGGGGTVTDTGFGLVIDGVAVKGEYKGLSEYGKEEYVIYSQAFSANSHVALYDFANKASWTVNVNPYSFGADGDESKTTEYVTKGEEYYTIVKDFVADVYIQIAFGDDTIYFELK